MKAQTARYKIRWPYWKFVVTNIVGLILLFATATVVFAHPLGNFTVNRYTRIEPDVEALNLLYIVDMAEIPTQQERFLIDDNDDEQLSQAEQDAYAAQQVALLKANLYLTINGAPVDLLLQRSSLEFPPGQAELPTLRLTVYFKAELPAAGDTWQVDYQDNNYADRIGWQEVVVRATIGARLLESNVSEQDMSQELRTYPTTLLQSPLKINTASFRFTTQGGQAGSGEASVAQSAGQSITGAGPLRTTDRFADLITAPVVGPSALLFIMLAAFGWGALHALSPGHGKTIVGAYLVGTRGTVRHALFLGLTTTVTHTIGVFLLGLITLFAAQFILPEKLFPWLSLISGLLVVSIGVSLVRSRLRWRWPRVDSPAALGHAQAGGSLLHSHEGGLTHQHVLPDADEPVSWRNLFALGVSGGLLPCPSALVLMLGAISLQRISFGIVLIVIFSFGLASVLTGIGVLLIYAGKWFQRIPEQGRLLRILPAASAVFITVLGIGITWQALVQTGVLGWG